MPCLLNEQQVIEILHNTTDSNSVIAKKYGVSDETVSKIFRNVNWKHIPRPNLKRDPQINSRKLTADVVRAVRNYERTDYEQIAKEYGCLTKTVKQLLCPNNLDWKYIPVKGYENYKGERLGAMPLRKSAVRDIFLNTHISVREMADKYNVGFDCIKNIRSGKRHGKYTSTLVRVGS
jgi:hypothetical protein